MISKKLKQSWHLIKETFYEFSEDNVMHYGASLSYYTIFAMPPILIVVIAAAGALFGREAVTGQIYAQLAGMLGKAAALQVQDIVEAASRLKPNLFAKIVGVFAIVVSSTGVFLALQDTLNTIWGVKARPKSNIIKLIRDRVLSFAMVISIAFLLLVSLVIHAAVLAVSAFMGNYVHIVSLILLHIFNFVIPLMVITLLFALLFKYLPDAKVRWKDVWMGAFVSSLLFSLGKYLIGIYLGNSNIGSAYGAAGTVIIILTWVFYSSILLFLGAEFTKVYALRYGKRIEPADYAVRVEKRIIDKTVPDAVDIPRI
jgi:membrane protein